MYGLTDGGASSVEAVGPEVVGGDVASAKAGGAERIGKEAGDAVQ